MYSSFSRITASLIIILEDPAMSYTMEDFIRETHQQILHNMTPAERQAFLDELPAEERLKGLEPEEVMKGLDPEQVKAWLKRRGN